MQTDPGMVETAMLTTSHEAPVSGEVPPHASNFVDFESVFRQAIGSEMGLSEVTPHFGHVDFLNPDPIPSPIRLGSDEVSAHVPIAIKQKIWSNQFLLKGSVELSDMFNGGTIFINENCQMETRPKVSTDKVLNLEKWTDAFLIFSSTG